MLGGKSWWCRKWVVGQALRVRVGTVFIVRQDKSHQNGRSRAGILTALLFVAPLVAGCASSSDIFSSDLLSKDADWFSRSGRTFIKNVSIETPPLTPDKPVTPDDLISADGLCAGMGPAGAPADANALTDGAAGARPGAVALLHTECDVARGIGAAPDNVNLSNNARGDRLAVLTYSRGPRAGIYTFTSGRLTSVERAPEAPGQPRTAKPKAKKKPAAT